MSTKFCQKNYANKIKFQIYKKLFREQTRGLYPYLSSQNYPYGSGAPVNALLQQQDYRRSCKYFEA